MPQYKSGPKRGQRVTTNKRADALRGFTPAKKTATGAKGAAVGGGT